MNIRNYRKTLIASALIAATTVAQAVPRHEHDSLVRARVISSVPVFQTVNEPRTECWTDTVGHDARRRHEGSGGAVIGAIAGGLLGSTIGKGNGRIAAAAVGAATGAVVGDRIDGRYERAPRQVERCETSDNYRQVLNGYDVRYRYQGREYSTQLPYDPGKFLNLRVSVAVAEDQRSNPPPTRVITSGMMNETMNETTSKTTAGTSATIVDRRPRIKGETSCSANYAAPCLPPPCWRPLSAPAPTAATSSKAG